MSVPHGGYRPTWRVMRDSLDRLSASERAGILGGNAERAYLDQDVRPFTSISPIVDDFHS